MKHLKRIIAIALAAMLVFGSCVTAFAATREAAKGTITLNGTTAGKHYRLYKVFDLTFIQDTDKVSYTVSNKWAGFFEDEEAGVKYLLNSSTEDLPIVTIGSQSKIINIKDSNIAEFAEDALSYATSVTCDAEIEAAGTNATVSNLDLGYYLVYPVGATDILAGYGSICSLTSTIPSSTIFIKAEYPTFTKTVDAVEMEGVQIGQKLNYELKGAVPDTTGYSNYRYEFDDTMSKGLTFNKDVVVKVAGVKLAAGYYVLDYKDNGFNLKIKVLDFAGKQISDGTNTVTVKNGDPISVTYSAAANAEGLTKISRNKAKLTYSVDPSTNEVSTFEQEVPVYTAKLVIDKFDGNKTSNKLPGAKFVLKNNESKYYHYVEKSADKAEKVEWVDDIKKATVVTTDNKGSAAFNGLKPGKYQLVETEAPSGYNLLSAPVNVEIKALVEENDALNEDTIAARLTVTQQVANNSGVLIPGTGGIGTTVFYVVGGLLVVGAAVLLITKKRMSSAE